MLQTLCYVSSSKDLTTKNLEALFFNTKKNNTKSQISGLLIYNNGNFLQILEGKKTKIKRLFDKIKKDQRHKHVIKLIDSPINERVFEDYEVGFVIVNNQNGLQNLKNYLSWVKQAEIESVDKVVGLIENFINDKFISTSN